jgi:hypothetical protein
MGVDRKNMQPHNWPGGNNQKYENLIRHREFSHLDPNWVAP